MIGFCSKGTTRLDGWKEALLLQFANLFIFTQKIERLQCIFGGIYLFTTIKNLACILAKYCSLGTATTSPVI